jgi:light-regulated signal transduction histidine kinase (bacteriophytochrome)
MSKSPVTDSANECSELKVACGQLKQELVERARLEEGLRQLNAGLELRLAGLDSQLAAAKEDLRREREGRHGERNKVAELEEKLARQKSALESLQQELDSLGYSISHDLAAPLRHVVGFSNVLMEDHKESLDATAQGYLDCIVRAARKMEVLIEALLGLSRISRQDMRPGQVDLSRMAAECAASLKRDSSQRKVSVTIADDLSARADAALLRTALERLFDNAWKYTRNREEATIEFGSMRQGKETVFFLRDNGAGFDMRFADRLFGPFQRMHRESDFEGTGIGLAMVQRIINRHGGKIWADAAVDGGATFYFTLPE